MVTHLPSLDKLTIQNNWPLSFAEKKDYFTFASSVNRFETRHNKLYLTLAIFTRLDVTACPGPAVSP